jgi:hypothetical protein
LCLLIHGAFLSPGFAATAFGNSARNR